MNKYKLSVIIPVYNAEEFLPRTIDSVLKSTLDSIEIIVVDDCSQGNCKEIIEKYENIKYIRHKKNKGLFAARCTGIRNASGEYIVHLDADDWIKDKAYEYSYTKAIKTNSDVVFFNVIQSNEDGKEWIEAHNIIKEFSNKTGEEILDYILLFQGNHWIWHVCWNKLIRNETAKALLNHFEKIKHINMYEDLLWSITLFLYLKTKNSISAINYAGLNYYRHSKSITKQNTNKQIIKKMIDIDYVMSKLEDLLKIFNGNNLEHLYYKQIKFNILSSYYEISPVEYKIKHPIIFLKNYLFLRFYKYTKIDYILLNSNADLIISKIKNKNIKEVSIFGVGPLSLIILEKLKLNDIAVTSFTVSKKSASSQNGIPILTIEESVTINKTFIIASIGSIDTIINLLEEKNQKRNSLEFFSRI